MPTIDGGGMDEVRFQLEPMAPYLDACNATDNTAAHAHASPLAIAIALQRCGMEPIMQLVCRDRNRLALEADIVGASLHGIENVCCLTGDDVTAGDEPEARRVFDLDSPQLLATARAIAEGRYLSGRAISPPPPLFLGAVENPGAPPHAYRAHRALKKAEAGARFLQLQICFEPELLEEFTAEAARIGLTERGRDPALDHDPALGPGAALHRREGAGHLGAGRDHRAGRGGIRPAGGVLRRRLRARPARDGPAGRPRAALHQLPQGRGHRGALPPTWHPHARRKG